MSTVRTTLTLEQRLIRALKEEAHRSGRPLKEVVNQTIERGLEDGGATRAQPYRLEPASLGSARAGLDLTKALALADALEDEEIARELELRK